MVGRSQPRPKAIQSQRVGRKKIGRWMKREKVQKNCYGLLGDNFFEFFFLNIDKRLIMFIVGCKQFHLPRNKCFVLINNQTEEMSSRLERLKLVSDIRCFSSIPSPCEEFARPHRQWAPEPSRNLFPHNPHNDQKIREKVVDAMNDGFVSVFCQKTVSNVPIPTSAWVQHTSGGGMSWEFPPFGSTNFHVRNNSIPKTVKENVHVHFVCLGKGAFCLFGRHFIGGPNCEHFPKKNLNMVVSDLMKSGFKIDLKSQE